MLESYFERKRLLEAWARHDAILYTEFVETVTREIGKPISSLQVLDLGCGANAPMTILLHASGWRVTGIDAHLGQRWGLGFRLDRYREHLKDHGPMKTLRKLAGEIVFDRIYYRTLAQRTGLTLTENGLDLRQADIQHPELPAAAFDVVHSNATWEHIPDVQAANRAVARALRPGGLAYIEIHLFPSLSGGHDLPWIVPGRTILGNVRPWQHLRDASWVAPVYLNRRRERDYRRAFEETEDLEVVEWRTEFTEGQDQLTPEIRAQLADYDEEELTKRSIVVVARRRSYPLETSLA